MYDLEPLLRYMTVEAAAVFSGLVCFVGGFLSVAMLIYGFAFRLGWRFADWLIRDMRETYQMLKEMFSAFISWLKKKVRR